jgi:hypothetical protein
VTAWCDVAQGAQPVTVGQLAQCSGASA